MVSAKHREDDEGRTVEISDNAVERLRPYAKASGPVVPTNFRACFDRVRVKSGFQPTALNRTDAELQKLLQELVSSFRKNGISGGEVKTLAVFLYDQKSEMEVVAENIYFPTHQPIQGLHLSTLNIDFVFLFYKNCLRVST